jgi:hypothetical protein
MGVKFKHVAWYGPAAESVCMELVNSIEKYERKRPLYCNCFALRDIKSGEYHGHVTGRSQQAICIFCNKAVAAWGKIPKGKRSGAGRYSSIKCRELEDVHRDHSPKCYPIWLKSIFYNYAIGKLPAHFDSFIQTMNVRFGSRCNDRFPDHCPHCWLKKVYNQLPTKTGTIDSINLEVLVDSFCNLNK